MSYEQTTLSQVETSDSKLCRHPERSRFSGGEKDLAYNELAESTMTLSELENTLPNGLHDSEVRRVSINYERRPLTLDLDVWVDNMDDPPALREAYRTGRLEITGLQFLVMEQPDPKYPFTSSKLKIDGCDMRKDLSEDLLESLPPDAFFRSLWVNEWNAFIHIAGKEAQIVWLDEGRNT
jgi:hypothetical protein